MKALIYSAHRGRGRPYIAVRQADAHHLARSIHWHRRVLGLPGVARTDVPAGWADSEDAPLLVADAEAIGLVTGAFWSPDLGPQALAADDGTPTVIDIDPDALRG